MYKNYSIFSLSHFGLCWAGISLVLQAQMYKLTYQATEMLYIWCLSPSGICLLHGETLTRVSQSSHSLVKRANKHVSQKPSILRICLKWTSTWSSISSVVHTWGLIHENVIEVHVYCPCMHITRMKISNIEKKKKKKKKLALLNENCARLFFFCRPSLHES